MPITITRIERQKKNKRRYSLFDQDKFIIGVSEESLLKYNIYSGIILSENMLRQIESGENLIAIREQAWRFLTRRMHSEKELRDKLINKGHSQEDIDKLRRVLRLTRELGVNLAGVEVILTMREKMEQMQEMMEQLIYYVQLELQKKEHNTVPQPSSALVKVKKQEIVVKSDNE